LIISNTAAFLNLPPQLQENQILQDAYIVNRIQANPNKRRIVLKEWHSLPESLKQRPEAVAGYIDAAIESIMRAQTNDEFYLLADGTPNRRGVFLDPRFLDNDSLIAAFKAREERINKRQLNRLVW
jgi:hypothetical protein